jgi:hypothetical protein
MAQRYVRPTVTSWILPTWIAPWLSTYGAVTLFAALGIDWGLIGKIAGWAVGMLLGSVWALAFCLMLTLLDVVLLAAKVRTLPSGGRAWAATLAAPLGVFGIYAVAPPHSFWRYGGWGVTAAVMLPMAFVAAIVRMSAGTKPPQ